MNIINPYRYSSGTAPSPLTAPTINGTASVGSTLTRVNGTYSGTPNPIVSGIWQRDGVDIVGETNATYNLVYADVGANITWFETAVNGILPNATQSSNAILPVLTIEAIINQYNYHNAWSSNNLTIEGTTTTANDYVANLNLSNPSAASQPTLVSNYLTFDGVNGIIRALVSNYRGGDSSGEFVSHIKIESGINILDLGTWSSSLVGNYINQSSLNLNTYRTIHNMSAVRSFRGSSNIASGWFTVTSGCTGSTYYIIISGNNETLTLLNPPNDGLIWLKDQTVNNSIAVGGRLSSLPSFANISWKFGGYRPYISMANSIANNTDLNTLLS